MPPTRKPASTRPRPRAFKEPPALKRLNKSLDTANDALAELRKATRRDLSQGAQDIYKDVRILIADARRDSGKLAKALARDFEQAEKTVVAGSRRRNSGARKAA
jgi:hypothetical protein